MSGPLLTVLRNGASLAVGTKGHDAVLPLFATPEARASRVSANHVRGGGPNDGTLAHHPWYGRGARRGASHGRAAHARLPRSGLPRRHPRELGR